MKAANRLAVLALSMLFGSSLCAQGAPNPAPAAIPDPAKSAWAYNLTVDGYIVPHGQSYVDPVFTANRKWLHLEARYNYENLKTGSLWVGFNFRVGKTLVLDFAPMIGGVFGRTNGIAPGCEASLTYKKIQASIVNEYVFDTTTKAGNFYFSWPQVTYSPVGWFRVGAVAQHTKAYQTAFSIQRGFLIGFSHKKWEFTTYVLDPFVGDTVTILELGVNF
jgi:hypothetical protein